jgi:hydrogenase maturation protease
MNDIPWSVPVLVIGYGNDLRGDDGVGPHIVGELATLGLAHVRTRTTRQLLPELAAELADVGLAIFVDAELRSEEGAVKVTAVSPAPFAGLLAHTADPASLLALTQAVYGRVPQAWLVTVPGQGFELGQDISTLATAQARIALGKIRELLEKASGGSLIESPAPPLDTPQSAP